MTQLNKYEKELVDAYERDELILEDPGPVLLKRFTEATVNTFKKDRQYVKFCAYGFLKNLRFYDAFLLLYFLDNGISFSQVGVLYAAREIVTNVVEIPSGIVADTFGRKNALIAAFCSYILSFLVFYYATNFNLLLLAILLIGIGDAFRSGTHKGMIMDYLRLNQWSKFKIDYYGKCLSENTG